MGLGWVKLYVTIVRRLCFFHRKNSQSLFLWLAVKIVTVFLYCYCEIESVSACMSILVVCHRLRLRSQMRNATDFLRSAMHAMAFCIAISYIISYRFNCECQMQPYKI